MKRTFTIYPSGYIKANSSTGSKEYTSHGFKFYVENSCIILEDPNGESIYIDDIPACLISNPSVRDAIYLAYNNFGNADLDTVSSILQERASMDTLIKIDHVLEKNGYPLLSEI